MNFIDLSVNRSGKSYYELINVYNISLRHERLLLCYFELDTFMGFYCALMGISWSIRPFITYEIHARLCLPFQVSWNVSV